MPKGKKTVNDGKYTSPQEVSRREEEAALWLYNNPEARYTDFVNYFKEKWNIGNNQASIYRREAFKKMNELIDDNILAKKKMASVSLLNRLKKIDDPKLELEYLKELNKVSNLYINNIDITSDGDKMEGFDISKLISFNNDRDDTETED